MKILVVNCGSSSLKYQLIDMDNESVLAKGGCERIGIEGSFIAHKPTGKEKVEIKSAMPTHKEAIQLVDKYKYQLDRPYFLFIKAKKIRN